MKRFYFTNENADNIMDDHIGNIRGARTKAQKYANENNETVIINDCKTDDMIDFIYPEEKNKTEPDGFRQKVSNYYEARSKNL